MPRIVGIHRHLLQILLIQVIRSDFYIATPHVVLQLERNDVMSDVRHKLYSINVVRPDIRSISLHQQQLYFTPANERLYDTPKTCFVHGCPLSSFVTVNIAG